MLAAPAARADNAWRTPLRLSEPTEIPGAVLQPGEYVIKVVDTQRIRSIVQFLNPDETKVVATVLAIPTRRAPAAEETEFTYFQRYEGAPQAMKSWIYPGENFGVEFVYPKAEAITLAEKTHEPVYATPAPEPTIESPVVQVTPEAKEVPYEPLPELPKTGSDLPLVGLLAAASLAGAAGLKLFR
jgi:LPXTG-motif cell wall-anchored protein